MPVLRGHHLICLHFFQGKGYDETFVRNLREVLEKVEQKGVKITDGVDDVCRSCPYLKNNRCEYDEEADEVVKEMDETALRLLNVRRDTLVGWNDIKSKLSEIFPIWYANYCYDCDWLKTCEDNQEFQRLKKRS